MHISPANILFNKTAFFRKAGRILMKVGGVMCSMQLLLMLLLVFLALLKRMLLLTLRAIFSMKSRWSDTFVGEGVRRGSPTRSRRHILASVLVSVLGSVWVPLLIVLMVLTSSNKANAQLSFKLTKEHITLKNNELVTFTAKVVNLGQAANSGSLLIAADSELQVISQTNLALNLPAGDSIFLPIKLLPTYHLEAGEHPVRIILQQNGTPDQQKVGTVSLPRLKSVAISAVQPAIQLLGNEDSVIVPIRVANNGNIAASVSLVTNLPDVVMQELIHKPFIINLSRGADTTVYISQRLPRKIPTGNAFQVNVLGFYTGGEQFGQAGVRVQLLTSDVKEAYAPGLNYIVSSPNTISISAQNAFSQNAYYWINGGGSIYLPADARATWHLDGTIYQYDPGNPYLRDTWLNFEKNGHGVTVGNLSRNLDLNIYGRGAMAYTMDSLHSNYYEAGLIDHSSNLLKGGGRDGSGRFSLKNGMAGWALIRHQIRQSYWQTAATYQQDELTQTDNALLTNDIKWVTKKGFRMEASLDGGLSKDQNNINGQKGGVLGNLSISGTIHKKLSFSSSNTLSTAYYPGQRKGAKVFSERIGYHLGKVGLWSAFNFYQYKPKTVSSVYNYQSTYGSTRAEMGFSTSFGGVSLSFAPYYTANSSQFYGLSGTLNPKISAWRVLSQINYNKNKFSTFLSGDLGFGKNNLTDKSEFQWHSNANLRYGFLSVSGSMQVGSFYATDALNSYLSGNPIYKIVTITPRIQQYFFHRNLDVNAGFSYNYVNSTGRNLSIDARLQYKISRNSILSATFMRYTTGFYDNTFKSLQLSFTTKMPSARIGTAKNSLELFFYKDVNDNGAFDKGIDSVAPGQQITINNMTFLTDSHGKVLYRNLPAGTYNVNNMRNSHWYADGQTIVLNKKKLTVAIPMHKIGMIEGTISYSYTRFSYELNRQKQGLTVKAVDKMDRTYTALTDEYGHYTLYLPTGDYKLYIDGAYLPKEIECVKNDQEIQVRSNSYKAVDFVLHVKDRKIETKKFYSISLAKNETASSGGGSSNGSSGNNSNNTSGGSSGTRPEKQPNLAK